MALLLFLAKVLGISLSGALAPGPVTAAAIGFGSRNRFAGTLMALGHAVVEFPLMVLLIFGVGRFLTLTWVGIAIGLAGGSVLVLMGVQMFRELKRAGNEVVSIVEARSHYLHFYRDKLNEAGDELIQTTIDGSEGVKGHALSVIRKRLEGGEALDLVIAVGCPFMMMMTGGVTQEHKVKTLVALNPIMVDGTVVGKGGVLLTTEAGAETARRARLRYQVVDPAGGLMYQN